MNYVEQIKAAVEAGGKVIWSVLIASSVVLIVEHIWPEVFLGLPEWALPLMRLAAIICAVLASGSILTQLIRFLKKFAILVTAPLRKKSIRNKLLNLDHFEVLILSKALAENDRTVWMKPDLPHAISLQDKGLLERYFAGVVIHNDGSSSFEVPMEVWRMMLSMEEFFMPNPNALLKAVNTYRSGSAVLKALPQAHPAIKLRSKMAHD